MLIRLVADLYVCTKDIHGELWQNLSVVKFKRYINFNRLPKEVLKELKFLSVNELQAKEEELKKELKELESQKRKKKPVTKHKDRYYKYLGSLEEKIEYKLQKLAPPHKETFFGYVSGQDKLINKERFIFITRLKWAISDHIRFGLAKKKSPSTIELSVFEINTIKSFLSRSKTPVDISFKEVKESNKYQSIYKIEGKLGKKIFTLQYYSISEKEIKKIQELEKLFLEEEHGQSINNSRQDTIKKILSMMPKLLKEAKQKKKNARLAMYDKESREIGSDIVKKIKQITADPYPCPYCNKLSEHRNSHVDHINPISNGGLSVKNNMVLVCSSCNLKKKDYSLWYFCKNNKLKYEEVAERLFKLGKWI